MPIRITGKKMTQQKNFKIPQDTLSPKIKHFTINTSKQMVNINVSILLSLPQALFFSPGSIFALCRSIVVVIVCLFIYKSLAFRPVRFIIRKVTMKIYSITAEMASADSLFPGNTVLTNLSISHSLFIFQWTSVRQTQERSGKWQGTRDKACLSYHSNTKVVMVPAGTSKRTILPQIRRA